MYATAFTLATFAALLQGVAAAPTNDVTLYTRALYQDCADSNNDYLAVDFLEGSEKSIASNKLKRDAVRAALATVSDHNVVYFSSRTNYIDAKIAQWVAAGDVSQIVSVAAGFDSRAYRLPSLNQSIDFFELDMPEVVADKQARVAANNLSCVARSCTYVGADLRNITVGDALRNETMFSASAQTVYVVEGLIYYLHQPDVDKLFTSLAEVASKGSKVVFDFTNKCIVESDCKDLNKQLTEIFLEIMHVKHEPWFSGFGPGTIIPYMEKLGLETTELLSFQDAHGLPLNVSTYYGSKIFGQMNFMTLERK